MTTKTNNTDTDRVAAELAKRITGTVGLPRTVIASSTGLSLARVSRALNELRDAGLADFTTIRSACFNGRFWR